MRVDLAHTGRIQLADRPFTSSIARSQTMKQNKALASLLVAAALAIPSIVLAAGLQNSVPGSTDQARAAAQSMTQNQTIPAAHEELRPGARVSSTDEARSV